MKRKTAVTNHAAKAVTKKVVVKAPTPAAVVPGLPKLPLTTQIVDSAGAVWTMGAEDIPGGHPLLKNGKQFFGGGGVKLVEKAGRIYACNSNWAWFVAEEGIGWVPATDPTGV